MAVVAHYFDKNSWSSFCSSNLTNAGRKTSELVLRFCLQHRQTAQGSVHFLSVGWPLTPSRLINTSDRWPRSKNFTSTSCVWGWGAQRIIKSGCLPVDACWPMGRKTPWQTQIIHPVWCGNTARSTRKSLREASWEKSVISLVHSNPDVAVGNKWAIRQFLQSSFCWGDTETKSSHPVAADLRPDPPDQKALS